MNRNGNSVSAVTLFRSPDDNATRFGLCGRYPDWLQRFATSRTFFVAFCIKNVLQGMVFSYIIGVETSMERHFKFDASTVGLLLTLSEIGPILTAVWISHTASYGNRPRWMGFGLMLIATGLFFGFFMNWIFQPPALNTSGTSQTHNNSPELLCRRSLNTPSAKSMTSGERCTIDIVKRRWAFTAWVFMFSLLGIGSTTVYTIGAPYLDDSIGTRDSPLYFGIQRFD